MSFRVAAVALALLAALSGKAKAASDLYHVLLLGHVGYSQAIGWGLSPDGASAVGYVVPPGGFDHASVWSAVGGQPVDMNPAGFLYSYALRTDGSRQVGYGDPGNTHVQALLWSGSASSVIDLTPNGYDEATARDLFGNLVGGDAAAHNAPTHAAVWSGAADSFKDLNPPGYEWSTIVGMASGRQVGDGGRLTMQSHALLWYGTADSAVDLNPSGYDSSAAWGVFGNQQVGVIAGPSTGGQMHATLGTGTANSAVDLHPAGFVLSEAYATNGTFQVGDALNDKQNEIHAYVWCGTAASGIDLQQYVPAPYTGSQARAIDAKGDIIGTAFGPGVDEAIIWQRLPEPSASLAIGMTTTVVLLRRR